MSSETPRFRVSPEITEAVMGDANSYDETLEYAKRTMQKAREKHLNLYGYLAQTAKEQGEYWYSYGIASALSYDIATRQLEARGTVIDITPDDLSRHKAITDSIFNDPRWNDEGWVLERVGIKDGVNADSGLALFLNILDLTAPELAGHIADLIPKLEESANRKPMLRGFFDGFMPFYRKILSKSEISS